MYNQNMYLCEDNTDEILVKHADSLKALRKQCANLIPSGGVLEDGTVMDDLFFVRYLLSNKSDIDVCTKKIQSTVEWRRSNAELLSTSSKHPLEDRMSKHLLSGHTGTLSGGEPVNVIRLGLSDCKSLLEEFSLEEISNFMTFEKAVAYKMCDAKTRETKRLVKAVTVIDFDSFNIFGSKFDKKILTAMGDSSKAASIYFPQLQVKTVAINTPSLTGMIKKLLGAVLPKSSMEKMVVCSGKNTSRSAISACQFCSVYGVVKAVPPFLGGTAATPICLQTFEERKELEIGDQVEEAVFHTITVANRSYTEFTSPHVDQGSSISFEISVEDKHIRFSAEVVPTAKGAVGKRRSGSSDLVKKIGRLARRSPKISVTRNRGNSSPSEEEEEDEDIFGTEAEDVTSYKLKTVHSIRLGDQLLVNPGMMPVRVDAENGLVRGNWQVPIGGHVVFRFDNTFSKLRSKKVTFRCYTEHPSQELQADVVVAVQKSSPEIFFPVMKLISDSPMGGTVVALVFIISMQKVFDILLF